MTRLVRAFFAEDVGATAIEYGRIAGLISVVILTALGTTGANLNTKFASISGALN